MARKTLTCVAVAIPLIRCMKLSAMRSAVRMLRALPAMRLAGVKRRPRTLDYHIAWSIKEDANYIRTCFERVTSTRKQTGRMNTLFDG
jgi:hypothetical protein